MKRTTPFSLSPNPNCLCETESITAVLERARFVVDNRQGLTVIIGDVGLGKSTIMRYLYTEYDTQDDATVCMIETPEFSSHHALLRAICMELKLETKRSYHEQLTVFKAFVSKNHKEEKTVIIFVDEAQKLSGRMLELLRALLNYESHEHKLVQIILAGQIELSRILQRKKNKGLHSRIVAPSVLNALTRGEMQEMIEHRCKRYNIKKLPFSDEALDRIYEISKGVPREALKLCALAYEMKGRTGVNIIDADMIDQHAEEGEQLNAAAAA